MASSTTAGDICHVPRPTDGIEAPVFRRKNLAIYALQSPEAKLKSESINSR